MGYEVTVKDVAPGRFAGVRATYRIADLGQLMGREYGRVMAAITAQGVQP